MIHSLHQFLLYLHISIGAIGLVVFWLPTLSKKGSPFHKKIGQVFVWSMLITSVSGIIMSVMVLIDPVGVRAPARNLDLTEAMNLQQQGREMSLFLLMLSMLVFVNVRQSVQVLKAKANRELLKSPMMLIPIGILLTTGIVVGVIALVTVKPLFIFFSLLSIFVSLGTIKYIYKKELKPREWIIEHMANIFGAGVASYTAFFAFGGRRFFSEIFGSGMQIIPWVLPSIIGVTATFYLARKYRKQYKINE